MVLRFRSLGRSGNSILAESTELARRLAKRRRGMARDGSPQLRDPLVLAYWPMARINSFQELLYNQAWRHGVVPVAVSDFEVMAALPWDGPMACHFHWLASIADRESLRRFEAVLKRLQDQRRSIVWTVHNVLPHDKADIDTAVQVRRAMVEAADLVHVMNDRTPELVEPYFSLAGKRVLYSPHPSYLGDHPQTVSREEARFELGLDRDTTVFLSFGAIQPYKGIEDLIDAAEALGRSRPDLDWALIVAGVPKDEALVNRVRRKAALHGRLIFHPHRVPDEDVQYFFRAADYSVCAYRSSLNSGAAMLALSFGVPLVAPETAAFSELLARGAGIGYAPDWPGALTAALAAAIETDPAGMGGRALLLAEERTPRVASNLFFDGLRSRITPA